MKKGIEIVEGRIDCCLTCYKREFCSGARTFGKMCDKDRTKCEHYNKNCKGKKLEVTEEMVSQFNIELNEKEGMY